jgi:hypothetical protein
MAQDGEVVDATEVRNLPLLPRAYVLPSRNFVKRQHRQSPTSQVTMPPPRLSNGLIAQLTSLSIRQGPTSSLRTSMADANMIQSTPNNFITMPSTPPTSLPRLLDYTLKQQLAHPKTRREIPL